MNITIALVVSLLAAACVISMHAFGLFLGVPVIAALGVGALVGLIVGK